MTEFRFTPQNSKKNEKTAVTLTLVLAMAGLVMKVFNIQALLGQILFFIGAALSVFLFLRFFYAEYTYYIRENGLFEIQRRDGRRITLLLSVPLTDIISAETVPFDKKPEKARAFYASFHPDKVTVLRIRDGAEEADITVDASPVLLEAIRGHMSCDNAFSE